MRNGTRSRLRSATQCWCRSSSGWVKVNTDVVVGGTRCDGFLWGVICNDNDGWIAGFFSNIGIFSVLLVELWIAYDDLCQVWRLGYRKVELDLDNITVGENSKG
ncbi:hypothetical protein V6N11_012191 [Hibiscus sabdariffa]|uniref:RNase H type-1 domain-containing protein n=2 Tax=Hibiscus sabdariffa TaxID=183260 RepID=A0ABR1ZQI5_9ROSI